MATRLTGFVLCALVAGCSGQPPSRTAAGAEPSGSGNGLVAQSAIDTCAGLTPAAAARLLDVQGREIKDFSRPMGESTARQCLFSTDTVPYVRLAFELAPEPTVEAARTAMARGRENMRMASGVIDSVTGSNSRRPPIEEIAGIGDEAFMTEMDAALTFRIANVVVTVTQPEMAEAKQRVAEVVIQGLR